MIECTKETGWLPANAEDAENWGIHVNCSWHLQSIVSSEHVSLETLKEIIETREPEQIGLIMFSLWTNPNLNEELLAWVDELAKNWQVGDNFNYWRKRFNRDLLDGSLQEGSTDEFKRSETGFANGVTEKTLTTQEASQEITRTAKSFAQQMWHDLTLQERVSVEYLEDSFYGSTFRPFFYDSELNFGDSILDALSDGYFTSWISYEQEIDEERADSDIAEAAERDGVREYEDDTVSDTSLCKALVIGAQNGDLEVIGDKQKYYADSGLFGESDYFYNVTIDSEPIWIGNRYRELTSTQQLNFVQNLIETLAHPFLGIPDNGVSTHHLVCIALHKDTVPEVLEVLRACSVPKVLLALEVREEN